MNKQSIKQIREHLAKNNHLLDKTIDVQTVKSKRQYELVCDKGHVFSAFLPNIYNGDKFCCPVCSGRKVLKGYNDIWTTHPEYAKLLKNPDDGYIYSFGSNVKLSWICPDCKREIIRSPNKMISQKYICNVCNDNISYAEKFIVELLNQSNIYYKKEKSFNWSNRKRYDFYIPEYACIIETHGSQHYDLIHSFQGFPGGKTTTEEQNNDLDKLLLASKSGEIKYYTILNCHKPEAEWIKKSLLHSNLFKILPISVDTIDWDKCSAFALKNITKAICEEYNKGLSIKELCDVFKLSYNAIKGHLKKGASIKWCNYDPAQAVKDAHKESGKRIVRTMSKPVIQMDNNFNKVAEYESIQSAQRQTGIYHIWDCITGKRNRAGGYIWKYKEEFVMSVNRRALNE